ncbi:MAG TPA: Ig-like domain-containing protein [Allosphingosinicella sp.]|nr:Ig-like domain-containing protein [Allosphingosinicella sp.]
MPNLAPAGTSLTRTIPRSYQLRKNDFGYSDDDGNAFKAVFITTLPGAGTLYYDSNGALGGGRTAVSVGQAINAADILAGKLTYVAPVGASGANYDHITFQVQDDGGTAGGGIDTDQSPDTLTFDLVASAATAPTFGSLIELGALSAADGFKIQGDVAGDLAGVSVSSAGDVNGDGFADIIVGAPHNAIDTESGAAYVIFGKASGFGSLIDLTGLSAANGFKIQGQVAFDDAGISVSSAGDVNGDGFADIIVGADGNDSGGGTSGAAYVIFGKASGFGSLIDLTGLSAADGFKIQGDQSRDHAGISVSSAGDINGDGFADLIIGATGNNVPEGTPTGAAYVIFGKATGFASLIDLEGLSATDGFKILGAHVGDETGGSVSSAGDVNGDGFADILVGTLSMDAGGGNAGGAYVIFGKSGGFGSLIDLASLSPADGFSIVGDAEMDFAGRSVSSAGDVNGDGFADILIGANGNDSGGNFAGAVYVIFGKSGGFGSAIDLASLSAGDGFKIQGDLALDQAGYSVSSAGDVNGDGYADILIGANTSDTSPNSAGWAYVIFGKSGGFGTLIDLTYLSAPDGFAIQGELKNDESWAVSAAGDVNGDGFDDILVGAPGNDSGGSNAGAAYVIFGRANILDNPGVDDPAVAGNDPNVATNENATVNILALANDFDIDGPPPAIAQVNGDPIAVGGTAVLPSGATVKLEANGTLTYDPNGQFNTLISKPWAEATGAVNTSAPDSFTYTLAGTGGGTATVSITVNGVPSAEDHLNGNAGNNNIKGTVNGDYIDLSQGGTDRADGQGNDDGFYLGSTLSANDRIDGGPGTNDQIALQGDYSGLLLTSGMIVNIEVIVVLPGFSYNLSTVDATVPAGGILKIQATQLAAGQSLTFNGSAEHDSSFLIYGGQGDDKFTGGSGDDGFIFGPGGFNGFDIVNGGGGTNDQLGLDGDYTITLGGNLSNIEAVVLLHGPTATPNHFDVTAANSLVAAGQTMTIFALQVETAIVFNGAAETDGAFKIYGGTNADTITGGSGADWLFGGNGADSLTGGDGNDIFYYDDGAQSTTTAGDTIFGFASGDKVDVSGIDAIAGGSNDAFAFLGSGAFTNHAGELRAENTTGSTWLVQGDTDGDGLADFQLTLTVGDAHPIGPTDFTL